MVNNYTYMVCSSYPPHRHIGGRSLLTDVTHRSVSTSILSISTTDVGPCSPLTTVSPPL